MKNIKLVVILILILSVFLLSFSNISFFNLPYSFGIISISTDADIILPSYLRDDFLVSKLKWANKLKLNDLQIEQIRKINKNSIKPFEEIINVDFLFLLEVYSENFDVRIHIYSFLHQIYCGNYLVKLDNSSISLKILDLLHSIISKISFNNDKDNFIKLMNIYSMKYLDQNRKEIFILDNQTLLDSLVLKVFLKYSNDENIVNYYSDIIIQYEFIKDEKLYFSTILFNISEEISKNIVSKKCYENIVINNLPLILIRDDHIKSAITYLLETKVDSNLKIIKSAILSYILLN